MTRAIGNAIGTLISLAIVSGALLTLQVLARLSDRPQRGWWPRGTRP